MSAWQESLSDFNFRDGGTVPDSKLIWSEVSASIYQLPKNSDQRITGQLELARVELDEQGKPIVIDQLTKEKEDELYGREKRSAQAIEPLIRALSAGQTLDVEKLAEYTRSAINPKADHLTDPDDIQNDLDWLEDFLGDRLHKDRGQNGFVESPWKVKFTYNSNDQITVNITHEYDKNLSTSESFSRDP